MTTRRININSRPGGPLQILAVVVFLVLAALGVPSAASADNENIDGVRAEIEQGILEVKGSGETNAVALRLMAADPTHIQIDVSDDGSADFSFARGDLHAIEVNLGEGDDSLRVDNANGGFTDAIPTTIAGGGGDSLNGGLGAETFQSGDGDDAVDGGKGNDTAALGDGNDSFR